jgi:hypothetical protein
MFRSVFAILALSAATTAFAGETWIAECHNVQFNFNRTAKSYLVYFKTTAGTFQMARGEITFDNGTALRGPVSGNSVGFEGGSLTEIGLNPSRNLVYVLYRHPRTGEYKSGDFCTASIRVVP